MTAPRNPVFVGGTGRSGSTILARLLGQSSAYTLVEQELQFHAAPGGLPDVLAGRIDVSRFVQRMRDFWYRRPSPYGDPRGLFRRVPATRFDAMLRRFPAAFERDRASACASLLEEIVESHPVAEGRGWIEMTPGNSEAAPSLLSMFPRMAVVNIVRSGLDVASSLTEYRWAPDDVNDCLLLWAHRYLGAETSLRRMPPGTVITVHLEELARDNREVTYRRLLTGLGIDDEPVMRAFFDEEITGERARIGRWRQGKTARERKSLMIIYGQLLTRMREAGVVNLPHDAAQTMMDAGRPSSVRLLPSRLRTWRWELWRRRRWQASPRTRLVQSVRDVFSSRRVSQH